MASHPALEEPLSVPAALARMLDAEPASVPVAQEAAA